MKHLNKFLHQLSMYRLVSYGLVILAALAVLFAATDVLQFNPLTMLTALAVLVLSCLIINHISAKLFTAAMNLESWLITALILFFALPQPSQPSQYGWLVLAAAIAMASKYVLTAYRHPIFNPAAIGLVMVGLIGSYYASWWVATGPLIIPTAILGLLIIHKLHRWQLFGVYAMLSSTIILFSGLAQSIPLDQLVKLVLWSSPLVFVGTIMLTEPATLPVGRGLQLSMAGLVAIIASTSWSVGPLANSPEIALVIANGLFFIVQPRHQVNLIYKSKQLIANQVYEFIFEPSARLSFKPGQYMGLTLDHLVFDPKGNRRTFSIASAPGQPEIRIGIKIPELPSLFKQSLMKLEAGQIVSANNIAGQFTLDNTEALIWVAGGIGITPFISMIRSLLESDPAQLKSITLVYQVSTTQDVAYQDVLQQAHQAGLNITMLYSSQSQFLDSQTIAGLPFSTSSHWYLSGPPAMVDNYKQLLKQAHIPSSRIKTDYFSGY